MRVSALLPDAHHFNRSPHETPPTTRGTDDSRPKMIKTFSLSALFFLSLGLLIVNAAQLPIA